MPQKVIPIRLSDSALKELHACERKFQKDRLLEGGVRDETEHTVFGRAYGVGIATYLVTQNEELALFQAWLSYYPELESEKKNIPRMLAALEASFPVADTLLLDYEVAEFNDKPAVELSFKLEINDDYYFVGYIDIVLKHRFTGIYFILDAKHTGLQLYDLEPLYKHSGQTLGYSVALDHIVGHELNNYGVLYFVAQLGQDFKAKVQILTFEKTLLDRLQWFMSLGMDVKHLEQMNELNFYPKRVDACLRYNRPCIYFGICELHSADILKNREKDIIAYDFTFDLQDLIDDHIRRIPNLETNTIEELAL